MHKAYSRLYQAVFRIIIPQMPWRQPELVKGEGCSSLIGERVKAHGIDRVLLVSDSEHSKIGMVSQIRSSLKDANVQVSVYDKTMSYPTIDQIEEAVNLFHVCDAQGIIALGGESSIDIAKAVGARIAYPNKTLRQLKSPLKVSRPIPPLYAIVTTAGTGGEVTHSVIVNDERTNEMFAISDIYLIPLLAFHDPLLTIDFPSHITALAGMVALTHAVEAYLNHTSMPVTRIEAEEAVKLIFENLHTAYEDSHNIEARENMLKAAFLAGAAFTKAYGGNVRAMAHQLEGFYKIPHGIANAVLLPVVLEYYGDVIEDDLAKLAVVAKLTTPNESKRGKAHAFHEGIQALNTKMNTNRKLDGIRKEDLPIIIKRALAEVNPNSSVPVIFNTRNMDEIFRKVMK